jgi:hypothetical protein
MITLESLEKMADQILEEMMVVHDKFDVGTAEEQRSTKVAYCRLQGKAQLLDELIKEARLVECA